MIAQPGSLEAKVQLQMPSIPLAADWNARHGAEWSNLVKQGDGTIRALVLAGAQLAGASQ